MLTPRLPLALVAFFVLPNVLTAQGQTWIVDAQNRPGTDFTDLPTAVQASSENSPVPSEADSTSCKTVAIGSRHRNPGRPNKRMAN